MILIRLTERLPLPSAHHVFIAKEMQDESRNSYCLEGNRVLATFLINNLTFPPAQTIQRKHFSDILGPLKIECSCFRILQTPSFLFLYSLAGCWECVLTLNNLSLFQASVLQSLGRWSQNSGSLFSSAFGGSSGLRLLQH